MFTLWLLSDFSLRVKCLVCQRPSKGFWWQATLLKNVTINFFIGNSERRGISTAKIGKGKYEAKLEIPRGGNIQTKKTFHGGHVDILCNHTMHYFLHTFKFNLILPSSNHSLNMTSFETLIVDWFICHVFTCEFGTILSPTVVTLSASCSVTVWHMNMWEINQSAINVLNEKWGHTQATVR